jgi:hypothetical protein
MANGPIGRARRGSILSIPVPVAWADTPELWADLVRGVGFPAEHSCLRTGAVIAQTHGPSKNAIQILTAVLAVVSAEAGLAQMLTLAMAFGLAVAVINLADAMLRPPRRASRLPRRPRCADG